MTSGLGWAATRLANQRMDRSGGYGLGWWLGDWPPPGHPYRYTALRSKEPT